MIEELLPEVSERDLIEEIKTCVLQIPEGKVSTYSAIADAIGDRIATRYVWSVVNSLNPSKYPIHRVIKSDGTVDFWKIEMLRKEGVEIIGNKVVNIDKILYTDFKCRKILKELADLQRKIYSMATFKDTLEDAETFCGIDIGYCGNTAVAAAVVVDKKGEVVDKNIVVEEVDLPYIPTYLAFREAGPMYHAAKDLDYDVLLVDGNGMIHPRKAGIAVHLGVLLDVPTIGIAKSKLCGSVRWVDNNTGELVYKGEVIGYVVRYGNKELYVSPGNYFSIQGSLKFFRKLIDEYRIEPPTFIAHRVCSQARRSISRK